MCLHIDYEQVVHFSGLDGAPTEDYFCGSNVYASSFAEAFFEVNNMGIQAKPK